MRRSRLDQGDSFLVPVILSPYRCVTCDKRFYRLSGSVVSMMRVALLGVIVISTILGIVYLTHRVDTTQQPAVKGIPGSASISRASANQVAADAPVQFELGIRYLTGAGAPKDYGEAVKWLEMAANGGHAGARYDLGLMYRNGFRVQRNDGLAYQWFDLAARQNHADAQYQAALMHKEGAGVPMDLVKAYTWAHISALQGNIDAVALRENLLQVLTVQQVQDGLDAVRGWNAGTDKSDGLSRRSGVMAR